ncbi:zinc-binding metallopeptidase [Pedobacter sp. MW01-1-1]|uniref:zinc-binding metallopeptidase n=1 Tax=Pedobacter sp. MW01-1-1 TaxID=3383027 RepID=UPI003FF0F012
MKKIYVLMVAFVIAITGCRKEDENLNREIVGLGGDTWTQTALDKWLFTNFTQPYNLYVKYRWDGTEYDNSKTLTPVQIDRVQPLMEVVKGSWIDPYVAEAGEAFVKKFAPKQYILVGSLQYNSGGTVTLGEAEGGVKVTLFNVNNFTKTDRTVAKRVLKTIHHEFTHILNQTITYQKEFQQITPAGYTADWNNASGYAANGFITQYAQAAPSEDFAEMVAIMLTEGKSGYEELLRTNTSATAVANIRKKEAMVVEYFKQTWGIDFYGLQTRIQKSFNDLVPNTLPTYLGFGKTFTTLTIDPATTTGLSADFTTAYESAKTALLAFNSTAKYELDNLVIIFTSATQMDLRINFHATAGSNAGTTYFALYTNSFTSTGNQFTFTETARNGNAVTIATPVTPLTNYFKQGPLLMEYFYSPEMRIEYGGFRKASNTASFTYGILGN